MNEKDHGMFIVVPQALACDRDISDGAKLLYGFIAALANKRGYCFASNRYLAEVTGVHEMTVSRHITALIGGGWLTRSDEITTTGIERRLFLVFTSAKMPKGVKQKYGEGLDKNAAPPTAKMLNRIIQVNSTVEKNSEGGGAPAPEVIGTWADWWSAVAMDSDYLGALERNFPGGNPMKAFEECYLYHCQQPNPPATLWQWKQKLQTWISIKQRNGNKNRHNRRQWAEGEADLISRHLQGPDA